MYNFDQNKNKENAKYFWDNLYYQKVIRDVIPVILIYNLIKIPIYENRP